MPAAGELTDYDRQTLKDFADVKENVERLLDTYHFRDAQKEAMNLARIEISISLIWSLGSWRRRICLVSLRS